MLEAYYSFNSRPFDKSLKPADLFISRGLNELISRLEYLKSNRGIMLLTGSPGVGKTTALRLFISKLPDISYRAFYVPLSSVNILDFYRQINNSLGGDVLCLKSRLFASIQSSIRDLVINSKITPVFIFDEAHLLKNENFIELQIIANFNMDSFDPAIIIVAGQSHLQDRLLRPVLKSFYQRILVKYNLPPLDHDETEPYISHILSVKGCRNSPFSKGAVDSIFKNSGGIPRLISSLAVKSMTCAMLDKASSISEEHVFSAAKEL
jgi:general secretion pathway protein A